MPVLLGDTVPDFKAESTHGPINSFHEYWCVAATARLHRRRCR